MQIDLKQHLLFATISGSRAYGISTLDSDTDITGFASAPRDIILGFAHHFEQTCNDDYVKSLLRGGDMNATQDVESTIYSLQKLFFLCGQCNPNMIEIVWSPEECWRHITPVGRLILEHRQDFLSSKCRWTFSGYAHAQLKRINAHRRWLLNPIIAKPERATYGLNNEQSSKIHEAEALIRRQIDQWNFNDLQLDKFTVMELKEKVSEFWAYLLEERGVIHSEELLEDEDARRLAAMHKIGIDTNLMELLERERRYRNDLQDYNNYQMWKTQRNPKRAVLEAKCGYDTKNASHLVRLYRMAGEILRGEGVIVRRPDADELLAIRAGQWTYDQLMEWVEQEKANVDSLYQTTKLPKKVNVDLLNRLCVQAQEETLKTDVTH